VGCASDFKHQNKGRSKVPLTQFHKQRSNIQRSICAPSAQRAIETRFLSCGTCVKCLEFTGGLNLSRSSRDEEVLLARLWFSSPICVDKETEQTGFCLVGLAVVDTERGTIVPWFANEGGYCWGFLVSSAKGAASLQLQRLRL
jgi:hypothetical protein